MKAECPNCGVVYQIDDAKIPDKGAYATCAKCRTRFHIKSPKAQNGESKQEIITCPNCGHQQPESAECEKCGIVFSKYYETQNKAERQSKKREAKEEAKRQTMMVKCAACGKTISENAKFCPHCGEPSGEEKARVETKEKPKKELERKKIGSKSTDQFVPYRWVFLAFVVVLLLIGAWVWYVLDHPTTSSGNRSK